MRSAFGWFAIGVAMGAAAAAAPPKLQTSPRAPAPQFTLQVLSPAGGERWAHGNYHEIKWRSAGLTGNVELILLRGDTPLGVIKRGLPVGQGSFGWFASNYDGGVAPLGGGYRVMIRLEHAPVATHLAPPPPYATSPGTFDLVLLTLTSPVGTESWAKGTQHAITWNPQNMTGAVELTLWHNSAYAGHIAKSVPVGNQSSVWTVGTFEPGPSPPPAPSTGGGFVVCIKSLTPGCDARSCSTQPFTIQ